MKVQTTRAELNAARNALDDHNAALSVGVTVVRQNPGLITHHAGGGSKDTAAAGAAAAAAAAAASKTKSKKAGLGFRTCFCTLVQSSTHST